MLEFSKHSKGGDAGITSCPVVSPAEFQCDTSSNFVFLINCSSLQVNEGVLLTMLSTENTECF